MGRLTGKLRKVQQAIYFKEGIDPVWDKACQESFLKVCDIFYKAFHFPEILKILVYLQVLHVPDK